MKKVIQRTYKVKIDESKELSKLLTQGEYNRLKAMNRQKFELQKEFGEFRDAEIKELLFKMYEAGYLNLTIENTKLTIANQYNIADFNLHELEKQKKILDSKIKKYETLKQQAKK